MGCLGILAFAGIGFLIAGPFGTILGLMMALILAVSAKK